MASQFNPTRNAGCHLRLLLGVFWTPAFLNHGKASEIYLLNTKSEEQPTLINGKILFSLTGLYFANFYGGYNSGAYQFFQVILRHAQAFSF
jgi:hypothetical protein